MMAEQAGEHQVHQEGPRKDQAQGPVDQALHGALIPAPGALLAKGESPKAPSLMKTFYKDYVLFIGSYKEYLAKLEEHNRRNATEQSPVSISSCVDRKVQRYILKRVLQSPNDRLTEEDRDSVKYQGRSFSAARTPILKTLSRSVPLNRIPIAWVASGCGLSLWRSPSEVRASKMLSRMRPRNSWTQSAKRCVQRSFDKRLAGGSL